MSGGTISTSETRVEALKLQSSAYGVTIPMVFGVTRVKGNMVWYGGFKAIPHTTSQGGKGGVEVQNTTYSYEASVMMGLCHGQVTSVPRVWRGKKLFSGGVMPAQVHTVSETVTVPGSGIVTVAQAASYVGVVTVNAGFYGGEWNGNLSQGYDYSVANGVFTFHPAWIGIPLTITYQHTSGGVSQNALQQLGLTFITGAIAQPAWSALSAHPTQRLGYSGLAVVAGQDYDLGEGANVENHNFEVVGPMAYHLGSSIPDVDVSVMLREVLTNTRAGAAFPGRMLDAWQAWSDFCVASVLLVSPAIEEQVQAAEVIRTAADLTNSGPVWSEGRLKMVPYADTAVTGNGRTFTPNTTPVYDLDDECYTPRGDGASPVRVELKAPSDRYNHVRVEYLDRANQYNIAIAEAKDQADIDESGPRTMDTVRAHWICEAATARLVAQLKLQRSLYVCATYRVPLPWHFALLEPMDLVTLTDTRLQMNDLPARVLVIEESEDGDLELELEDYPAGSASAALYPSQAGVGFAHDYNATPGPVDVPVFVEAPVERTLTGLEVYAAVKGSGANWGGCNVWVSLDGTNNYRRVGTVRAPARFGRLTSVVGGTVGVETSGQLVSGSAADAAALESLCYIGGATPEYFAYTTATLTGPGAYTLGGLVRGAFSSSPVAHAVNDTFVRIDDAIGKSGPLDPSYVGRTIHFKFTSFNVFGAGEQSLADVPSYPYLVTGAMLALPPSQPTQTGATLERFGVRLSCAKNPEPDVLGYEWRLGAVYATAEVLEAAGGTTHMLTVQQAGAGVAWVAAVDRQGNRSTPVQISFTVPPATLTSLVASIAGPDLVVDYSASPGAFALAGYDIRHGDVYASAVIVQSLYQATRLVRRVDWGGARRWWVTPIDVRGNAGTPVSIDVTVTVPGAITSPRSEVVDNNALLYWGNPSTGSLPIDRYNMRRGETYASGEVVGTNGNSTFTAIFEQQAGQKNYWVVPVDTAGNEGPPVAIPATINQPPDYILRTNVNFVLSDASTKSNMYFEAGALRGPVNTTETWSQHFSTRSWASPQAQIDAGYPIYATPSVTSGSYEETFDYGTVLASTIVTSTLGYEVVTGSVTATCQIYVKAAAGDAWTAMAAGMASVLASNFRYVRVVWTFTCTAGANLISVLSHSLKLANKIKRDGGTYTITDADAGVWVAFNTAFIDADTPVAQPGGTTPLIPVVDFTDAPNPTGCRIYHYNTSGSRVTGSGSWNVQGY